MRSTSAPAVETVLSSPPHEPPVSSAGAAERGNRPTGGEKRQTESVTSPHAESAGVPASSIQRIGQRTTVVAFLAAVLLGGSNFVAVRFSNRELDPLWGAATRFGLAAAIFAVIFAALRLSAPRRSDLRGLATYGLLGFGIAYGFLYLGMREVPAGVAAAVMASGPLLTLFLAAAHGMETVTTRALLGGVIALIGSAVMFIQPEEANFGWLALAAVGLAALAAAESVVIVKRAGPQHPVTMNLIGMGVGATTLFAASAAKREAWALPHEPATVIAFVYLVTASVTMFVLVLLVIRRWTASASSYIFVLMPPIALMLGALLGGEAITLTAVVGGLVVLVGVCIGVLNRPSRQTMTKT